MNIQSNRPKIYSYSRFSSDKQRAGHSEERQSKKINDWLKSNKDINLEFDTTTTISHMIDRGKSGFKDINNVNDDSAALGQFLNAVRSGRVSKGSYLLVEAFNRLTRQAVMPAVGVLSEIINAGIILVTLNDGKRYDEKSINEDMNLIYVVFQMGVAHKESQNKSDFIRGVMAKKRKDLLETGKPMGNNTPRWLECIDKKSYKEIPKQADAIRLIFDLIVTNGWGITKVCNHLNEAGEPKSFSKDGKWRKSTVKSFITTRRVIGWWTSKDGEHEAKIYPEIISPDVYYKARDIIISKAGKSTGRNNEAISNLFTGLATCGHCGKPMHYHAKKPNGLYLVCAGAALKTCKRRSIRYTLFEEAFLKYCTELDFSSILSPSTKHQQIDNLNGSIASLNAEKVMLEKGINGINRAIKLADEDVTDEEIQGYMSELRQDKLKLKEIQDELAQYQQEFNSISGNSDDAAQISLEFNIIIAKMRELQAANQLEDLYILRSQLLSIIKSTVKNLIMFPRGINNHTRNSETGDIEVEDDETKQVFIIEFFTGVKRIVELKVATNEFVKQMTVDEKNIITQTKDQVDNSIDEHVNELTDEEVAEALTQVHH
tara:strand:+ start:140 stop:1942 length:1803 start_codon:yes stop_codon:yes gene_type:complete